MKKRFIFLFCVFAFFALQASPTIQENDILSIQEEDTTIYKNAYYV